MTMSRYPNINPQTAAVLMICHEVAFKKPDELRSDMERFSCADDPNMYAIVRAQAFESQGNYWVRPFVEGVFGKAPDTMDKFWDATESREFLDLYEAAVRDRLDEGTFEETK